MICNKVMNMKGIEVIMQPALTQGKIITKTTSVLGFGFKKQLISQGPSDGTDDSVCSVTVTEQGP